jgi:tRNA threonylcarbamoyladenosine biosynthesis protein TsaB
MFAVLLALDTATDAVCTALVDDDGRPLAEVVTHAAGGGARTVLADVDHVLAAAGVRPAQLRGIAVGRGPGSFTGVRIGLATAAALADAASIALAGVSTLDALLHLNPPGTVVVVDARRREVFAAGPGLQPAAYSPADLAARLAPGTPCAGDGALRYRAVLEAAGAAIAPDDAPLHLPLARAHAALARFDGTRVTPLYLREPDATPQREPAAC